MVLGDNPFLDSSAPAPVPSTGTTTPGGVSRLLSGAVRERGMWKVAGMPSLITDEAFTAMINTAVASDMQNGTSLDQMTTLLRQYGLNYGSSGNTITVTGFPKDVPEGPYQPQQGTTGSTTPLPTGGGQTAIASPAGSGGGSYGGSGGSGGASIPAQPSPWGGGENVASGGLPIIPGGGAGTTPIDPSKPLGIPSITPQYQPGANYFGAPKNVFPSAGNPFAGLGPNSNLYDVIAKIAGAQVGNQQAALDIQGGVFNESLNSPTSTAFRGRIGDLLANPYSMDENTIQAISGRHTDRLNRAGERMGQEASARAASAGLRPDSGAYQAQQTAITSNTARAAAEAERDTRIQAAIQNQQDIRSALGAAGGAIDTDLGRRERIADKTSLGILGETAITGDAFLTNALLAAQGKQTAPSPYGGGGMRGGSYGWFSGGGF